MEKKVYEFISKQTGDPIVEWKTCKVSGEPFAIFQSDVEMLDKLSPIIGERRYPLPIPTLCPSQRQRLHHAQINQIHLFKQICSGTWETIVTNSHPNSPTKVMSQKYFWSDEYDPLLYWRDYDNSKSFLDQIHQLDLDIPKMALFTDYTRDVNSAYTNYAGLNKNCYLMFDTDSCEDCYYWYGVTTAKYAVDCYRSFDLEHCYEIIDSHKCFQCQYLINCESCTDSLYLRNCVNCKNCILCNNLVGQSYMIRNRKVSKEVFEELKQQLHKRSARDEMHQEFMNSWKNFPQKNMIGSQNQNGYGNCVVNSKNARICFDSRSMEDERYCSQMFMESKDCFDCDECGDCRLVYNCNNLWYHSYKVGMSHQCLNELRDIWYCKMSFYCSNSFGCIGLKRNEYCILNKQYTKEEYEKLVPQIIEKMIEDGERGNFFPIKDSLAPYNLSMAQERDPLTKEEAQAQWFWREDKEIPINISDDLQRLPASELPEEIKDITDDVLSKAIVCSVSGKVYRITSSELAFYRKHNIPIPNKHFEIRHSERTRQRPPRALYLRTCDNCSSEMLSVYPKQSEYKVFCEACYNKEVYW